jgi:pimeloyl-ACP methyl ester carboxylesterase
VLVRAVDEGALTGAYRAAAARFVDYWNGPWAWDAMAPRLKAEIVRYLPKAPLDFRALIDEPGAPPGLRDLRCPMLVLRGEHAPRPSRLIADRLAGLAPHALARTIPRAGHMGALTHSELVAGLIAEFVRRSVGRPARSPASQALAAA